MNLIMNDLKYTDEKMKLRADCLRSLNHYIEDHARAVFEFSTTWCEEGNTDIHNIEECFLNRYRVVLKS